MISQSMLAMVVKKPVFDLEEQNRLVCCTFFYRNHALNCEPHHLRNGVVSDAAAELTALIKEIEDSFGHKGHLSMKEYCGLHCGQVQPGNDQEWNAFIIGDFMDYYLRFCFLDGGYPLKVHCYAKGGAEHKQQDTGGQSAST